MYTGVSLIDSIIIKTGHYKSKHDECDYYITFKFKSYYMRRIGSVSENEQEYIVKESDIIKSMLFGGFYLVRYIPQEEVSNNDKNYKEHSTRKTKETSIPIDKENQIAIPINLASEKPKYIEHEKKERPKIVLEVKTEIKKASTKKIKKEIKEQESKNQTSIF